MPCMQKRVYLSQEFSSIEPCEISTVRFLLPDNLSVFLKTFIQIQGISHNIINYFEIHLNLKLFCFEVIVEKV